MKVTKNKGKGKAKAKAQPRQPLGDIKPNKQRQGQGALTVLGTPAKQGGGGGEEEKVKVPTDKNKPTSRNLRKGSKSLAYHVKNYKEGHKIEYSELPLPPPLRLLPPGGGGGGGGGYW